MPHEFAHVGLSVGVGLTVLVGAWCVYTMHLIAHCTMLANASASSSSTAIATYGELVTMALGPTVGATLGTANLVLHQLLCCAAYLVFIGETVARVFALRSSAAAVVAATLPYAALRASGLTHEGRAAGLSASGLSASGHARPMGGHKLRRLTTTGVRRAGRRCTLRDMRLLAPTSASGTAILAFVLLAVLWEGFAAEGAGHGPRLRPHAAPSPSALASFVGVGLFAFAGEIAISARSAPDLRPICVRPSPTSPGGSQATPRSSRSSPRWAPRRRATAPSPPRSSSCACPPSPPSARPRPRPSAAARPTTSC